MEAHNSGSVLNMEIAIKKATLLEHTAILELLLEWFNELTINGLPHICGFTGVWLAELISKHMVITACIDKKIVGILGLKYGFMPWNNEVGVLFGEFLMTDKEYREKGVADKIIEAAKAFSKQTKLTLMMGHFTGTDASLKDKFLCIKGFQYGGGNFFYKGD